MSEGCNRRGISDPGHVGGELNNMQNQCAAGNFGPGFSSAASAASAIRMAMTATNEQACASPPFGMIGTAIDHQLITLWSRMAEANNIDEKGRYCAPLVRHVDWLKGQSSGRCRKRRPGRLGCSRQRRIVSIAVCAAAIECLLAH